MKHLSCRCFRASMLTLLLLFSQHGALYADNGRVSEQQAVNIALQSYPGRVLSVKREAQHYRVKILSDSGEVRNIKIDADKGKVVSGR